MPVLRHPCAVILTAPAPSNYRRNSPAVPYRALKSHAPPNPIPSPTLRPLAHGRRPSRQIPSRPPKGNPARPSKLRWGKPGENAGNSQIVTSGSTRSDRRSGRGDEPADRGRRRNLWWVAPRLGNRAMVRWRERSDRPPRWGERRAIGGRRGGEGDRGRKLAPGGRGVYL